MEDLKGCPFCGGHVEITSASASTKGIVKGTFECDKCGAVIKLKTKFTTMPLDALDEAWNGRAEDGN